MIGEEESGFLAAELSPCEELLVLATGNNKLMLFDKEFNQVDEKPLDDGEGTGPDLKIEDVKIVWRFDSNVDQMLCSTSKCSTETPKTE